jgi:hypothetical protein
LQGEFPMTISSYPLLILCEQGPRRYLVVFLRLCGRGLFFLVLIGLSGILLLICHCL